MAIAVEGATGEKIWELYEEMCVADEQKDYQKSLKLVLEMWDLLPEEKLIYAESWVVVSTILELAIEYGDKETMQQWIDKIDHVTLESYHSGERECYKGKVAYELGDYDAAREYLSYANKKSRGRCFGDKDKKYIEFLNEKK